MDAPVRKFIVQTKPSVAHFEFREHDLLAVGRHALADFHGTESLPVKPDCFCRIAYNQMRRDGMDCRFRMFRGGRHVSSFCSDVSEMLPKTPASLPLLYSSVAAPPARWVGEARFVRPVACEPLPTSSHRRSDFFQNTRGARAPRRQQGEAPPWRHQKLRRTVRPPRAERICPRRPPPCTCCRSARPNAPVPGRCAPRSCSVSGEDSCTHGAPATRRTRRIAATSCAALPRRP